MKIAGYDFEGPFKDPDEIEERKEGVYVVLCSNRPDRPLYIGTAGEGISRGHQGVRERLKNHDKKKCFEENCENGQLEYAVMYISNQRERLSIEGELQQKYDLPC